MLSMTREDTIRALCAQAVVVSVLLIALLVPGANATPVASMTAEEVHRFVLDSYGHNTYGLSYPVTLVFSLPPGVADLTAHKEAGEWVEVPTRLATEVFSGVEAARFDYVAGKAYVSVSFPAESDELLLTFTDAGGDVVSTSFDEVAHYYDDSQAAVVVTGDDWQEHDDADFVAACNACQARGIWFTPGICTQGMAIYGWGPPDWNLIQQEVDEGFVEPASHSRNHLMPPYDLEQWGVQSSYVEEIGGSKIDILANVSMPSLNCRGAAEYLYAWIEPFGRSDTVVRQTLGQFAYLSDRGSGWSQIYAAWDSQHRLYRRVAGTVWIDSVTVAEPLNEVFDSVCESGGIHHMMCHPRYVIWEGGAVAEHLDYVANRADVWYVGFGHLYAYHYMDERHVIVHSGVVGVEDGGGVTAGVAGLRLLNAMPNPFAARTEIRFAVPGAGSVRLGVYDVSGRLVRGLLDGREHAGWHVVGWSGCDDLGVEVVSGVYFMRVDTGGETVTRRVVLMR